MIVYRQPIKFTVSAVTGRLVLVAMFRRAVIESVGLKLVS